MQRTILLTGVLPFVSAFLGGVLAFSLVTAPQATAQPSQPPEVRAAAFTLVDADGTILARLGAGTQGDGNLTLFDASGARRLALTSASGGGISTYDAEGVMVTFRAGHDRGEASHPPVNGVLLSPDGSVRVLP